MDFYFFSWQSSQIRRKVASEEHGGEKQKKANILHLRHLAGK
jgi:hypothetical protein